MSSNLPHGHGYADPPIPRTSPALPEWNPAVLLNPKAAASKAPQPATRPSAQRASPATSKGAPALSFQFASPNERRSMPPPSNHVDLTLEPAAGGMDHMLEQLHNVEARGLSLPPPKRRRVESEQPKSEFRGGSSGVLGNHVREGSRVAANGTPNTPPVDLTAADEPDVVVLGDGADIEVCYGRVEGVNISAFKVPTPKPGAHSLDQRMWPQVKIVLKRRIGDKSTCIHAADSTRTTIGCVDVNTSIALAPLLDSKLGIRTASRILSRPRLPNEPPPGSDTSCRYNLDLVLYGPRKHVAQVGRYLSQKQMWLRTPLSVEANIELCNPHQKENLEMAKKALANRTARGPTQVRSVEEVRNDVIGMFDKIERTQDLHELEPNDLVLTKLLRHQKQALYFMTNKEKEYVPGSEFAKLCAVWKTRPNRAGQERYYNVITGEEQSETPRSLMGGILADMMGLGKTLSILSLITYTLKEADEWSQQPPPPAEGDQVPLALNAKATLLVCPLSTIANWEEQIKQHIATDALRYYIYHGSGRIKDPERLAGYDIVITTYGSISSELSNRSRKKEGQYPLEEINWFRIVLDEAHMIREQSTLQSKAICRLQANRRWAVTGTPVQNRLDDLGALLKFLRLKPFDERERFAQYILGPCKLADPDILPKLQLLVASITLRRLKDKIDLPKRYDKLVRLDFTADEREVYDVFQQNASAKVQALAGHKNKALGGRSFVHILQAIHRLRRICAHGKDLLSDVDLKLLEGITKSSAIELDSDDEDEKPVLNAAQVYDAYRLMKETNADTCIACSIRIGAANIDMDDSKDEVIAHMTPCYHLLCNSCVKQVRQAAERSSTDCRFTTCMFCDAHVRISYFPMKLSKIDEDDLRDETCVKSEKHLKTYAGPHTKTKALLEDLKRSQLESEAHPDQAPFKSVVLSTWTSHLDLIQIALEHEHIPCTRLDGKMSRAARTAALDRFRDDPLIRVILVSITAGGLGLNLTAANRVYVMEPQYNPALEAQAIDRVHRLGQTREVETVRYIMNHSFEEKMLDLQEKKKKLASLSIDAHDAPRDRAGVDKKEAMRKRLEDLKDLFR